MPTFIHIWKNVKTWKFHKTGFLREVKFFCVLVLLLRGRRSKFSRVCWKKCTILFLLPIDIVVRNPNMFLIYILLFFVADYFSKHWITWLMVDSRGKTQKKTQKNMLIAYNSMHFWCTLLERKLGVTGIPRYYTN